jgi:hypothetical protein
MRKLKCGANFSVGANFICRRKNPFKNSPLELKKLHTSGTTSLLGPNFIPGVNACREN